jgi:hypothetical protein
MNAEIAASGRAREAAAAIERRFGWLKSRLVACGGNLQALKSHEQVLWYGRQKIVQRFNTIGQWRNQSKRERAYEQFIKELAR